MRIAIARQKYTPFGGAERFIERALAGIRSQGVEATVIAREWSGDPGSIVRCNPFYLGRTWRDAGFARCVQRIVAEGRFDLVQSHERIPGCHVFRAGDGVHATWLELRDAWRSPAARVGTRLSPWHRYTLAAEAAMYRHPALRAVICNSQMVSDDIARRFGVPGDRLHVIHNGVDPGVFHPGLRSEHRGRVRAELGIAAVVPVILFVGSGFERKGLPALLRGLARMERRDACLVVVGKDRNQQLYEKLAQTLGIEERVRFLGGRQDVKPYYGCADLFCLPTLYDPLPNAALEALACGLPVVTTTGCGAAELLHEGVNGFVCGPNDPAALAERLDRYDELDADAARDAVQTLSPVEMAGRLAVLYKRLVMPPARGA